MKKPKTEPAEQAITARSEVFGISELLDHILSLVDDLSYLVNCQRVSKRFRYHSRQIRCCPQWKLDVLGPKSAKFTVEKWVKIIPDDTKSIRWRPVWVNPTLHPPYRCGSSPAKSELRVIGKDSDRLKFNPQFLLDFAHPEIWESMFITWPPCFNAIVNLRWNVVPAIGPDRATLTITRTVSNLEGLKLGDLVLEPMKMTGRVDWTLRGRRGASQKAMPRDRLAEMAHLIPDSKCILDVETPRASRVFLVDVVNPTLQELQAVE